MLLTPAQIKSKSFESRRNSFFFSFLPRVDAPRVYVRARLLPQSYQYRNLLEGADRVGGQLRGDQECPFSGVTKSGRVWRKVPESGARSVTRSHICPESDSVHNRLDEMMNRGPPCVLMRMQLKDHLTYARKRSNSAYQSRFRWIMEINISGK